MRTLALCCVATIVLVAAATSAAKSPPFVGVWKGTVKSASGGSSTVALTLTPKLKSNNSGTIVWSQPRCTGKLAFLKQSGRMLTLRETILSGPCPKGGAITLTQIDFRTVYFEWTGAAPGPSWRGYLALGGR